MITEKHLNLFKHIMNNPNLRIREISQKFDKSSQQILNDISELNFYLPKEKRLKVKKSVIENPVSYLEFTQFTKSLNLTNYSTSQLERIELICVLGFFSEYVNLSNLYDSLGISLTTKKKDTRVLEDFLEAHNLRLHRVPGKGIRISGPRFQYRILVIKLISKSLDLQNNIIVVRQANSPIENIVFGEFISNVEPFRPKAKKMVDSLLKHFDVDINYYSRKLFALYILIALFDMENRNSLNIELSNTLISPIMVEVFLDDEYENLGISYVVSMLDLTPSILYPENEGLSIAIENFYKAVQNSLRFTMITKDGLLKELYAYTYKQYFFNFFNYAYDDKLVRDTDKKYPEITNVIKDKITFVETYLNTKFDTEQITSFTLIFFKWISKNKLLHVDRKKIAIVTNISFERVNFFVETLHSLINFEHIATININELSKLETLDYEILISFSNRTTNVLNNFGYSPIQVHFFVENDDLIKLFEAGCTVASNRLEARKVIEDISGLDEDDARKVLIERYEGVFM